MILFYLVVEFFVLIELTVLSPRDFLKVVTRLMFDRRTRWKGINSCVDGAMVVLLLLPVVSPVVGVDVAGGFLFWILIFISLLYSYTSFASVP